MSAIITDQLRMLNVKNFVAENSNTTGRNNNFKVTAG